MIVTFGKNPPVSVGYKGKPNTQQAYLLYCVVEFGFLVFTLKAWRYDSEHQTTAKTTKENVI